MKFVLPSHVYAINHYICQYPANLADMSLDHVTLDSQCFLKDNQGYLTLTFDARENMLYYFGNHTKTISRIPMELGGKGMVLTGGTSVVNGMALDWVAGNLYWTETDKGIIKVSTKTGAFQRVLIKDLINPFGIVVHPGRG
ncbi:low-density lipoprotein receptor-related protein 6-like [Aplysia californica]|uniref:Low-density lipoprotein receptor-related protein 6-like n=1 Tax=Aplysia californica TaxID=6500 RepID=A0ABM1W2R8_APLCA|nr:low-density lipoprotein receptor-related protein 6-like [Aplysia californica]